MQRLFDSEINVMEVVWEKAPVTAKEISVILAERIGWNKNTTYTVIKKLIEKGYIERSEPNFTVSAIISREDAMKSEANSFAKRFFGGSKKALFSALLGDSELSSEDIEELKRMLEGR